VGASLRCGQGQLSQPHGRGALTAGAADGVQAAGLMMMKLDLAYYFIQG
jgi:hypothetical protein